MSRAFVKEQDGDANDDSLPERPESAHPNYVTASGLADLRRQLEEALAEHARLALRPDDLAARAPLARIARDIRYLRRRVDDAILVDNAGADGEVTIGASVTIDDGRSRKTFTIVGEDEADPARGFISWTSPLGSALVGARRNDTVVWKRPVGDITVTVVDIGS